MDVGLLNPHGADAAYGQLARDCAGLSPIGDIRPLSGVQTSQRGFGTILASAEMLGIEIDRQAPLMRAILSSLITAEVTGNVVQAAKAIVNMQRSREAAKAAALIAANSTPPIGWATIALATAAGLTNSVLMPSYLPFRLTRSSMPSSPTVVCWRERARA